MVPKKVKTGALKVKDRIINSLIYNTYYHSKVNEKIVYLESRDGNDFTGNILRIAEELSTGEYGNYKIYVFAKKEIHPKIKELEETYNRHMSEVAFADETRKKNIQRILPIDLHNIEETKMKKEEELTRIGESGIIEKEHQLLSICRITLN